MTKAALTSFFTILEQQRVPPEALDATLREIATSYRHLQTQLHAFTSDDPAIVALKQQAQAALDAGDFDHAERCLNDASTKDLEAATQLQETAAKRLRSAAASKAENGTLKEAQLRYHEAADYYRQAVEYIERLGTESDALLPIYLNAWGGASYRAGDYREAEPLYQRALAIREQVLGPEHPDVAMSLNNLAGLYRVQGRYEVAEPLYQRALAIRERVLGPEHPHTAAVRENYITLLRATDRHEEAE